MNDPTVLFVRGKERPGDATTSALERSGLQVFTADDPVTAVQPLEEDDVDCVVLAPPLADPGAAWFADRVHHLGRSVPVLLIGRRDGDISPALATQATDYVAAEDVSGIADRIRSLVADRRAERTIDSHRALRDRVQEAMTSLPGATDRAEVERTVYEALAASERYRSVWVGVSDGDAIRLRFPAPGRGPDEAVGPDPAVTDAAFVERAIETGTVCATGHDRLTRSSAGATRGSPNDPRESHARSALAVPLVSGDTAHGVVVLETSGPAVDDSERSLLADLGVLAGREIDRLEGGSGSDADDELLRFASGLAHEFRNTLGIASTHLELGREGDEQALDVARSALDDLERTIDGMLSLASGVDETTTRDLGETASDAWEGLETGGAELVLEDTAPIEADHDQATLLLSNLLLNSVKHGSTSNRTRSDDAVEHDSTINSFSSEESDDATDSEGRSSADETASDGGSTVTVRIGMLESGFYVEDDGPGIPESERDDVFEWGYANGSGPGVGLAIVDAIADAHGWSIEVTESRDDGARFEVTDVRLPSD